MCHHLMGKPKNGWKLGRTNRAHQVKKDMLSCVYSILEIENKDVLKWDTKRNKKVGESYIQPFW